MADTLLVIAAEARPGPGDEAGEMASLCRTAGFSVGRTVPVTVRAPTRDTYFGRGKVEELAAEIAAGGYRRVQVSRDLSAVHQRNLADAWGVEVVDRTNLILLIFSRHARSAAGKLQVELARASRSLTRLTGRGTTLSRLGGGVGTRGPGEMKLEEDRRRIRQRVGRLKREIADLEAHRRRTRERHRRLGLPEIVLVGYTNAGKSSLLNTLCRSREALAADRLFSTLDPTTRRVHLGGGRCALVTDTVGVLRDLPHELIAAFHATLEGLAEATLLLVVLDGASAAVEDHYQTIDGVLEGVGARAVPRLIALNKADLLDEDQTGRLVRRLPEAILVSTVTGQGIERLKAALAGRLAGTAPAPPGETP